MKFFYRSLPILVFTVLAVLTCLRPAYADFSLEDNFPGRTKYKVNDYAGVLTPQTKTELERELQDFQSKKKIELIVTVIPDLGSMTMDAFMDKYTKKWYVMRPFEKHRRIHVVVCIKDAQMHIGVGYPLMRVLHANRIAELVERDFVPSFEEEDYDGGILTGVRKIVDTFK